MDKQSKFSRWFESKYLEWQAETHSRQSIDDFAKWLGFKRAIVGFWMNGDRTPGQASADRLALKLGSEVYELLNLEPSDLRLVQIEENWDHLTELQRAQLEKQVNRYVRENSPDFKPENKLGKND